MDAQEACWSTDVGAEPNGWWWATDLIGDAWGARDQAGLTTNLALRRGLFFTFATAGEFWRVSAD
jgi:hypothetical protein